jgi:hypothetical protein
MTLDKSKQLIRKLSFEELRELDVYIHTLLEEIESSRAGADIPEERQAGSKIYRLQRVKCGKPNCKCASGEGHGPYWYAYWWEKGRTRSKYIGKTLREA